MTTNEQAFEQAEKELAEEKTKEIKELMKNILQEMQKQREIKTEAEDRLRILKMEMEDLKEGKIDKIKERHEKSRKVELVSPIKTNEMVRMVMNYFGQQMPLRTGVFPGLNLPVGVTSGVYTVTCSNGTTKEFYI